MKLLSQKYSGFGLIAPLILMAFLIVSFIAGLVYYHQSISDVNLFDVLIFILFLCLFIFYGNTYTVYYDEKEITIKRFFKNEKFPLAEVIRINRSSFATAIIYIRTDDGVKKIRYRLPFRENMDYRTGKTPSMREFENQLKLE